LVVKLERLLQTTYIYFSSSLKRHLEHGVFAKLHEIKGLKLFHNVKIGWISMLSFVKWVFAYCNILVVKMNDDLNNVAIIKTNLGYIC